MLRVPRSVALFTVSFAKTWNSRTTLMKCIAVTRGSTMGAPKANADEYGKLHIYRYHCNLTVSKGSCLVLLKSSTPFWRWPPQTFKNKIRVRNTARIVESNTWFNILSGMSKGTGKIYRKVHLRHLKQHIFLSHTGVLPERDLHA
jgi:hypothetical protein